MKIKKYKNKLSKIYLKYSLNLLFKRKINKLISTQNSSKLTKKQIIEIKNYFSKYGFNRINTNWHKFFTSSNNFYYKNYIPESLYYTIIEPTFNRQFMGKALMDKNILSTLYQDVKQPRTIINNINGFYYSNKNLISTNYAIDICNKFTEFVIKPSIDSGGGKKVNHYIKNLQKSENTYKQIKELLINYNQDFIIQEIVNQNKQMKLLNKSSLNTIRIFSYLRSSDVVILSSIVRIGRNGQFTDNSSTGGISCGVSNDGKLSEFGYDSFGNKYAETDNKQILLNFKIPKFNEIIKRVKKLHKNTPNFKFISWDIAIDDLNEIVLIEYNITLQEINFHQLNNGPLFGDFTEEILNLSNRKLNNSN